MFKKIFFLFFLLFCYIAYVSYLQFFISYQEENIFVLFGIQKSENYCENNT